jgi:uncharacterized iron-regulated membrane protein
MAPKKGTDLGAALTGLILGGSVLFLVLLTIVWLTNSHFQKKEASEAAPATPVTAPVTAPAAPATAGTATPAPVPPAGQKP